MSVTYYLYIYGLTVSLKKKTYRNSLFVFSLLIFCNITIMTKKLFVITRFVFISA